MAQILELGGRNRKLAAILHADVVGFSRLMGLDEEGTHRVLGELRRAVDPLIASHGGRIVSTAGDSVLADFSSVVDALNCAIEMQRAALAINEPLPPERRLALRIRAPRARVSRAPPAQSLRTSWWMDTPFSAMAQTAPPDSRRSPSPARFASP